MRQFKTKEELPLRHYNSSKKWYTGKIITTNKGGALCILGQSTKYKNRITYRGTVVKSHIYFICQFVNSGALLEVEDKCLERGTTVDPLLPSMCGVGFLGVGSWVASINYTNTKEYALWKSMLERCYSPKRAISNPSYKNCTVDPRWHNFQNFCEDIQELEGYAEWKADSLLKGTATYELDKDIKVKGNKIYSEYTCMFTSALLNIQESRTRNYTKYLTGKTYVAHRIADGYEEEFKDMSKFSKEYDLIGRCISRIIHGGAQTHKGWTFKIKEEQEEKLVGENK